MKTNKYNIVQWTHNFIKQNVKEFNFCIDATAGRGGDTLFLCENLTQGGHVLSFDIQKEALNSTKDLLDLNKITDKCTLINDSHANMLNYAKLDSCDCILFNFGYLPGGNHNISTNAQTSIAAITCGLDLLKTDGLMSLLIYSGGDSGFSEKNAILDFLRNLDSKKYLVISNEFFNMPNNPPMPIFIFKL